MATSEEGNSNSSDFASQCLKKRRKDKTESPSAYLKPTFILPTSDSVYRFFSSAGYAHSDYRQRLLPIKLERQLFLKVNPIILSTALNSRTIKTHLQLTQLLIAWTCKTQLIGFHFVMSFLRFQFNFERV